MGDRGSSGAVRYLRALGPGLVTGASDDDPSGIATYAQSGATFGLGLLWASLLTLPLMASVQETCDRTALATGKTLGELVDQRSGRRTKRVVAVLVAGLIAANALNIAADLVAVGSGMTLLHAGPTSLWALVAGVASCALLVSGSFHHLAQVFKVLCLSLLSYVVVLFLVHPSWPKVVTHLVVPHVQLSGQYLSLLVAVLGTTISPYLFFWQSAHRVEEMRDEKRGGDRAVPLSDRPLQAANVKLRTSRLDVFAGMTFSNVVMFAIIVVTATSAKGHHAAKIQSAADAAKSLKPLAGQLAGAVFALGFIGTGMLAVPVLAASGAIGMAGLFGKRWGFSRSLREAPTFYGLVLAGAVIGTALSLVQVNAFQLLVLSALVNGIVAAPLLCLVMVVANDERLLGDNKNGLLANVLGWTTVAVMAVGAVVVLVSGG